MIPKIIHYCWFGKGLMPKSQKDCIKGWKKLMPDYQFMRWDESNFDLEKFPLAKYACQVKKYALAADQCRYNVLAEYGGIYLDTDVEVFERFDRFLDCNFFSGIELYGEFQSEHVAEKYLNEDGTPKNINEDVPYFEILSSSIACCKGLKFICEVRDLFNNAEATPERALHFRDWMNHDRMLARNLARYGFKFIDETQRFGDDMVVYGTGVFGYKLSPNPNFEVTYHHNAASWGDISTKSKTEIMSVKFDKLGLLPLYKKYKQCKKKLKRFFIKK